MKKSVNLYFNYNIDTIKKLDAIKTLGYDEFFTGVYDNQETLKFLEQITYAKKLGLRCSMVHCSYYEPKLNNFWLDNDIGEQVLNSYLEQIKMCRGISKNFVVHLNGSKQSIVSEIGLNRIKKLLKECEKHDINLCIENLYSDKEIPYIFDNIKHKNLKICFDIGHKNCLTPNFDLMKDYGEFVTVLHLHDNDGKKDLHNIIGTGTIDWEYFAKQMTNRDDLVLCSEVKQKDDIDFIDYLIKNLNSLTMLDNLIQKIKILYNIV